MSEKITTPYGRITPEEYAIEIAKQFPSKSARREPGEITLKKQTFFLQKLAERTDKGPVFMKNLKEVNEEVKEQFSKEKDNAGKPIPLKAGLSIGRLMKDEFINRVKPESNRYVYFVAPKGEELLNTVTPTPEVVSTEEKAELADETEALVEEEEVE